MKYSAFLLLTLLSFACKAQAQDTFQLAPPYLRYASAFFEQKARVELVFAQHGARIHYTTNGQVPTERDPVYHHPIGLNKPVSCLKARVFSPGFKPSETVEACFFKKGLPVRSITATPPHVQYPGEGGSKALIDGKGGFTDLNSPTWMGYQPDTVVVQLGLQELQVHMSVSVHVLQNQPAWVFLPQEIKVFGQVGPSGEWVLLGHETFPASEKNDAKQYQCLSIALDKPLKTSRLMIKIFPLAQLPDWHKGKGLPAWVFIDEINVY